MAITLKRRIIDEEEIEPTTPKFTGMFLSEEAVKGMEDAGLHKPKLTLKRRTLFSERVTKAVTDVGKKTLLAPFTPPISKTLTREALTLPSRIFTPAPAAITEALKVGKRDVGGVARGVKEMAKPFAGLLPSPRKLAGLAPMITEGVKTAGKAFLRPEKYPFPEVALTEELLPYQPFEKKEYKKFDIGPVRIDPNLLASVPRAVAASGIQILGFKLFNNLLRTATTRPLTANEIQSIKDAYGRELAKMPENVKQNIVPVNRLLRVLMGKEQRVAKPWVSKALGIKPFEAPKGPKFLGRPAEPPVTQPPAIKPPVLAPKPPAVAPVTPKPTPAPLFTGRPVPKELPLLGGKKRVGKITQLPRGETFMFKGMPYTKETPMKIIKGEKLRTERERLLAEKKIPTIEQLRQAHIIAREKALITPEGKTKPQYRKLAQGITGKKSMRDMTQQEANSFINALKKISEPTFKKGVLVPPSVPVSKDIVPKDFFKKAFKKPTPAKLVTSQARYAELLGVKELAKPFEIGRMNIDSEYGKLAHQIDKATQELKKQGKEALEEMAVILNTQEEAPTYLSPEKKKAFDYFRDLTREMIERENQGRTSLGLEPIKYRQSYFRHIADVMSQEIIEKRYPLPEGLKYWSEQIIGKKVYNPMEMKRKLEDDLLKHFSKDLPYVMKSMTYTALKEINFAKPQYYFNKILGALSKDKLVYKNLTPEEQRLYDAQMTMPASTKKWLLDYINIVLRGRQTALDESVNLWITDTPIKDVVNSILKPFGKHIGQKPVTDMVSGISKLPIYGAMGGVNPRQIIRNKFQRLQDMALYGVRNTLKGFLPTSDFPVLEKLKSESLFKKSYSGFEDLPMELRGKIEKIGLAPYQWSALSNVSQSMNASYHWTADNIQNPKKKHLGWADPKRTYTEDRNFFYPSESEKLLKEMEYGAHTTQYQYIGMGMPEIFRYKALAPITRLQSWWMNHWFVFHREAATRAFTGHPGYDPKLKITLGDRINYLKYLILGGLILTNMGYYRSYLFGTAPTSVAPTAQLMMGLYNYYTNTGDTPWEKRKQAQAEYQIKQALLIHIPGYLSVKDAKAFLSGEKNWTEYLFYKKWGKEEEPKFRGRYEPRTYEPRKFKKRTFTPRKF